MDERDLDRKQRVEESMGIGISEAFFNKFLESDEGKLLWVVNLVAAFGTFWLRTAKEKAIEKVYDLEVFEHMNRRKDWEQIKNVLGARFSGAKLLRVSKSESLAEVPRCFLKNEFDMSVRGEMLRLLKSS